MSNPFVSKLDLYVYRAFTYVIYPLLIVLGIIAAFQNQEWIFLTLIISLQMYGLHKNKKLAYWCNYLLIVVIGGILKLTLGSYFESSSNELFESIVEKHIGQFFGVMIMGWLCFQWRKTKPLFEKIDINNIDWNMVETKNISKLELFLFIGLVTLYISYSYMALPDIKIPKNIITEQKQNTHFQPNIVAQTNVETQKVNPPVINNPTVNAPMRENPQPRVSAKEQQFYQAVQSQIPELSHLLGKQEFVTYAMNKKVDFRGGNAFELIKYVGENKDASLVPKIREVIIDYYRVQNQPKDDDIKIGFSCSLTDNRDVFVSKKGNLYAYTIFKKGHEKAELAFTNTSSEIQGNSLLHKNGITLVMKNGNYQYRIQGQGTNTTLFVYNGTKALGSHYCSKGTDTWNFDVLPYISVNAGSASHKQYCKQILNESVYLAKMEKVCPYEANTLGVSVTHMALFFDSESCGYLIQGQNKNIRPVLESMGKKLDSSIATKQKKLGISFCSKEGEYMRKMAERYSDFFNKR